MSNQLAIVETDKEQTPVEFVQSRVDKFGEVSIDDFAEFMQMDLDNRKREIIALFKKVADKLVDCRYVQAKKPNPARIAKESDMATPPKQGYRIEIPLMDSEGKISSLKISSTSEIKRDHLVMLRNHLNTMVNE